MEVRKWWILICFVFFMPTGRGAISDYRPWRYECDEHRRCIKRDLLPEGLRESTPENMSFGRCKLTCDPNSVLLPRPRKMRLGPQVTLFRPIDVGYSSHGRLKANYSDDLLNQAIHEQMEYLLLKKSPDIRSPRIAGVLLDIEVELKSDGLEDEYPRVSKDMDESYSLRISYDHPQRTITAKIVADNYFGARHGVETLFQLIEFDEAGRHFIVLSDVEITDWPEFSHRGISLDVSRNFMRVEVLKDIVRGMAHSKLNVLHLHLVDSHTWPVEQKGYPANRLTQYGAYGPDMVYTQEALKDLVEYANMRGVRIVPELDQPSHAGNGWQGLPKDYAVCLNKEPWYKYCLEPPCGQLNPVKKEVIDVLQQVYSEWWDIFRFDTFHLGADEIHLGCYNSSEAITGYMEDRGIPRTKHGFLKLVISFMNETTHALKRAIPAGREVNFVVWNSHLTNEQYIDNLDPANFTVHIWSGKREGENFDLKSMADKGYKMIFSNVDSLYLDCGFGAWVGEGNNWCTPYKGWQKIYSNDLYKNLEEQGVKINDNNKKLVLGAEVCMWAEQVDSETVEAKIFPRAAAHAERLWTNPNERWYEAEQRMLQHRWRLTHRGVQAEKLQPEWCRRNGGQCYWKEDYPFAEHKIGEGKEDGSAQEES